MLATTSAQGSRYAGHAGYACTRNRAIRIVGQSQIFKLTLLLVLSQIRVLALRKQFDIVRATFPVVVWELGRGANSGLFPETAR
jgi:hypothetical protein